MCSARIGLKSTVMYYKTIKSNINIHNFHFCGTQFYITTLRAKRAEMFWHFSNFCPNAVPFYSLYGMALYTTV